jgi:hypothetical protein
MALGPLCYTARMSTDDDSPTGFSHAPSDPLSGATRDAKRNLLLASVVAVIFKGFNISIQHISVAGINTDFNRGVFQFLILISLIYFFVTFCLYYYIDIRNVQQTDHQLRTSAWASTELQKFTMRYWEETAALAAKLPMPPHTTVLINQTYVQLLNRKIARPRFPTTMDTLKLSGAVPLGAEDRIDYLTQGSVNPGQRGFRAVMSDEERLREKAEFENAARDVNNVAIKRADEFPNQYRLQKLRLLPRVGTVRTAYFIRNYGTDGPLPIAFAVYAFLVFFDLIPVAWMQDWVGDKLAAPAAITHINE